MLACNSIRLEKHVRPVGLVDTGATKTYARVSIFFTSSETRLRKFKELERSTLNLYLSPIQSSHVPGPFASHLPSYISIRLEVSKNLNMALIKLKKSL